MTQPLRDIGVDDSVVDAIDKPLRKVIDRAYDGPRPGEPATAQPANNVRVKSSEKQPGLSALRSSLKKAGANLRQLGQKHPLQTIAQKEHDPAPSDVAGVDDND